MSSQLPASVPQKTEPIGPEPAAAEAAPQDVVPAPRAPGPRRFDRSIIEGPLTPAVWKLAGPTMLQNVIGGLQGMVDHAMVGHYVGYQGNAAIGVSWQIFLVVVVFISSLFTGMSVLVARFAGAGEVEKVNRTVYQAFLTAAVLSLGVLAPVGYFLSPALLTVVNAAPEVAAEALPYLRITFVFSWGMLMFFMLGGALRSAGDARTPLRLGIWMTAANLILNVILIRGLGPIPRLGTTGAALGTVIATCGVGVYALIELRRNKWVIAFPENARPRPDWAIIRALFRFGLPTGVQGVAMNIGGVLLLAFIGSLAQSAAAQAAYTVVYTQLFSLVTWTAVGLMGAAAVMTGQNLGAGNPQRANDAVHAAGRIAISGAAVIGVVFLAFPRALLSVFGMAEPEVVELGVQLLRILAVSGIFIAVALTYTGGLQGSGDTRSPLHISIVSQVVVPLGICFVMQRMGTLDAIDIWAAILIGHMTRCALTVLKFRQGRWQNIAVDIEPAVK